MTIQNLAERLGPLDEMRTTPAARRFTLAVWRALRDAGQPLDVASLGLIAADAQLRPTDASALVERYAEFDTNGAVVGLSGLSLADHPHRIEFEDRTLTTWCVWDPFFLIPALGGTATVRSADPQTGTPVWLSFEGGRVTDYHPRATLISIVVPPRPAELATGGGRAEGSIVEDLWASFCNQVLPFESPASGERYFAERDEDVELVTVEQAAELAQLRHGELIALSRGL